MHVLRRGFVLVFALALVAAFFPAAATPVAEAQRGGGSGNQAGPNSGAIAPAGQPQVVSGATAAAGQRIDPSALPKVSAAEAAALAAMKDPRGPSRLTQDPAALAAGKSGAGAPTPPSRGREGAPAGASEEAATAVLVSEEVQVAEGEPTPPAQVGKGFTGMNEAGLRPLDPALSVGKQVVQVINSQVQVRSKSGGSLVGPTSLQTWFGLPGTFIFDPYTVYRGDRHYIIALRADFAANVSQVLVSASTTGFASGAWCNYVFPGRLFGTDFADFPRVGATESAPGNPNARLVIATNQFDFATGAFVQNMVTIINKDHLDACAAASFVRWFNFDDGEGTLAFTQVPVHDYDANGGSMIHLISAEFPAAPEVNFWRGTTESFTVDGDSIAAWDFDEVATLAYSVPPDAPQPGTGALIATNDQRMLEARKRYNDIWAFHTTGLGCGPFPTTSNAHIMNFNSSPAVAAPTLNFNFYYDEGCGRWDYFPAGSSDGNGDMLFFFNRSSPTLFPRGRAGGFHSEQGIGASVPLGPTPCACTETRAPNRWGDYSGVSIDIGGAQDFVWGTWMREIANNVHGTWIQKVKWQVVPTVI